MMCWIVDESCVSGQSETERGKMAFLERLDLTFETHPKFPDVQMCTSRRKKRDIPRENNCTSHGMAWHGSHGMESDSLSPAQPFLMKTAGLSCTKQDQPYIDRYVRTPHSHSEIHHGAVHSQFVLCTPRLISPRSHTDPPRAYHPRTTPTSSPFTSRKQHL